MFRFHLDTDRVMVDNPALGPGSTIPLLPPAPGVITPARLVIQRRLGAGQVRGAVRVCGAARRRVQVKSSIPCPWFWSKWSRSPSPREFF